MKRFFNFFCLLALCGCSEFNEDYETPSQVNEVTVRPNHFVTLSDINALCEAQSGSTRAGLTSDFNVKCFTDAERDTLLYMLNNQGGGWTIYSSDTRVPAIVAYSSNGTMSEALENENLRAWIDCMSADMKVIRQLKDNELNFSSEEIKSNEKFWNSFSQPDKVAKEEMTASINGLGFRPIVIDDPTPYGHYELIRTESHVETYDSIGRLTKTNWRQINPFNEYCPRRTDNPQFRAPAGCVAIAAAQMLYFLHEKFNVPEKAPSEAECIGNVDKYEMSQSNFTSEYWSKMNKEHRMQYAAPLVANIGKLLNNKYGNEVTYANALDMKEKVFKAYGIQCTNMPFDTYELCQNLYNGLPVIVSVLTKKNDSPKVGHSFIVDKYKRERIVTKNTYRWKYDNSPKSPDGTLIPIPNVDDKIEYAYSSPYVSMIGFNWGWGYKDIDNSQWFALVGDWMYNDSYNVLARNRSMVCDFEVLK